jgi:dephospho-CoA kinase
MHLAWEKVPLIRKGRKDIRVQYHMLRIGLTGGIGCGKTTVADRFRRKGIAVLDADEIARSLAEPGQVGWEGIVKRFGPHLLDPNGNIDRGALREIVFNSPAEKKALEEILHPLVYQRIDAEVSRLQGSYCIVCVPLLVETGQTNRFDRILVIDCPVEFQYERVKARDRLDRGQIARIIDCQSSREERLSVADDVIINDADLASLDNQVEKLHNFYLAFSKSTG